MEWISVKDRLPDTPGQFCILFLSRASEFLEGSLFAAGQWSAPGGKAHPYWYFELGNHFVVLYPGQHVTHWAACTEPIK